MDWIKSLLHRKPTLPPQAANHALQNELQSLRLELAECRRNLEDLRAGQVRAAATEQARLEAESAAQLEQLAREVASAVSQLSVQHHLLQQPDRLVAGADVMAVTLRIIRSLEQRGLTIDPQPGEMAAFDASRHLPLRMGQVLEPGQAVIIRFPGIWFRGKMLAKAQVEQKEA